METVLKNKLSADFQYQPITAKKGKDRSILRFRESERIMHWAIAVPFIACWVTALVLVIVYNQDPTRPYREIFSTIHRCSAVGLIIFPIFAAIKCRGDCKVYFYNIKQAWLWTIADIKWIFLMSLAKVRPKRKLPDPDKFNASERINFMFLMGTYPIHIITGISIWLSIIKISHWLVDYVFIAWIIHFVLALQATLFIVSHIYFAIANRRLPEMVSGFIDREWAKNHYARWYRENFETSKNLEEESHLALLKILLRKKPHEKVQLVPSEAKKNFEETLNKFDSKNHSIAEMGKLHYLLGQVYEEEGREKLAIRQYKLGLRDLKKAKKDVPEMEKVVQRLTELKKKPK